MRPSSSEVEDDKRARQEPSNGRILRNTPSRRNRFKPYSRRLFADVDDVQSAPSTSTAMPSYVLPEPAEVAGDVPETVQRESQCEQNSERDVIVDPNSEGEQKEMTLKTNQNNGKQTFWYFLLRQLMDPSRREIVAWAGRGREFRIRDEQRLAELWCAVQGRKRLSSSHGFRRNLYNRYGMNIFAPVSRKALHYSWQIEPSAYVNMTRGQLDDYIRQYSDNSPTAAGRRAEYEATSATVSPEAPPTESNPYAPRDTVTRSSEKSVLAALLSKPSPCPPCPPIDTVTPNLLVPAWPSFDASVPFGYYGSYPYCYQPAPQLYTVPEATVAPTSFQPFALPWFGIDYSHFSPDPFYSCFPFAGPFDTFWHTSGVMR